MTVDTAIMIEAILVLSVIAIILIGRLMWRSGGEFVPETMKVLYRMVMDRFTKMGWADPKPRRLEVEDYPNRREDS